LTENCFPAGCLLLDVALADHESADLRALDCNIIRTCYQCKSCHIVCAIASQEQSPITSSRTIEHRKAASRAGLNYVTDGVAGITRRRAGKGWIFFKPDGERVTEPEERRRINALVIPPAWTDVWIAPDSNSHIQATARDARGRKQYRYHARYREARDQSKFRHMLEFSEVLPAIRERAERDLRAP